MVGQRLFRKVTQAWINGSYNRRHITDKWSLYLSEAHVPNSARGIHARTLTPCSRILSVSHLSSLRYSRREASAARSITKANGVPFSSIDRDWKANIKRRVSRQIIAGLYLERVKEQCLHLQVLSHIQDARELGLVILLTPHVPLCHRVHDELPNGWRLALNCRRAKKPLIITK